MKARQLIPDLPPGEDELPTDDGVPMESWFHREQMNLLVDPLVAHWKDRSDFYVAGNMPLYFSAAQIKKNDFLGPDVMVILDTVYRPRKSWVVWYEERTPDVVIELLSPSTEANDRGHKMQTYARTLRVSEYFLYDPIDGRFEGYELHNGMYVAMIMDEDGGFASQRLGLRLAPYDTQYRDESIRFLRWFTAAGALLPTDKEWADEERQRADGEQERADEEAARADQEAARARAAQALAEEERQRADEEAARAAAALARADEEAARAAAAQSRADEEAARAAAALARAEALAARLRALGVDPEA